MEWTFLNILFWSFISSLANRNIFLQWKNFFIFGSAYLFHALGLLHWILSSVYIIFLMLFKTAHSCNTAGWAIGCYRIPVYVFLLILWVDHVIDVICKWYYLPHLDYHWYISGSPGWWCMSCFARILIKKHLAGRYWYMWTNGQVL